MKGGPESFTDLPGEADGWTSCMSTVLYPPSIRLLFVQTLVLGRAVTAIMGLLLQLKIASAGAGWAREEDSGYSGHFAHPGCICPSRLLKYFGTQASGDSRIPWAGTGG